jgi:peptidoglycan LD-endopeptidase LytH
MKKLCFLLSFAVVLALGCKSVARSVFGPKTPHEHYADRLRKQQLDQTPQGRQWLQASLSALQLPLQVNAPFRQRGYFPAEKPRAIAFAIKAQYGERLHFSIERRKDGPILYADVFELTAGGTQRIYATDTAENTFYIDVSKTGTYLLRLQPELYSSGYYSLAISKGPSLGFPVSAAKSHVGSVWGDARDGGMRTHEGIDIFAPKGSPAIAAADAYVTSVREGGIGGKVVWLQPKEQNVHLYYAHLDAQLVQSGQLVRKGDTIGLVGNTGNARTTPAHLHFGIYGSSGAIDPLPFVKKQQLNAGAPVERELDGILQLVRSLKFGDSSLAVKTKLVPLGITEKTYLAEVPSGGLIAIPFSQVRFQPAPRS